MRPGVQVGDAAASSPRTPSAWLRQRGWSPFAFQRTVWRAIAEGRSGLLHATTGAGKTYAVWLGALAHLRGRGRAAQDATPPLQVLWLTPMRALAADSLRALDEARIALAPGWTLGSRTGDTSVREREAQRQRLPSALVTTPESLSLLLARADAQRLLGGVRLVVVDEWHELMGNKRGVQVQLALARLTGWQPALQIWGLSATLGNLDDALRTLLPRPTAAADDAPSPAPPPVIVRAGTDKPVQLRTLLPSAIERFAWAGHMGLAMLPQVAQAIESAASTLVFANTRSQAERWYQALLAHRPQWAGELALHHGSLDLGVRRWVEQGLSAGSLRAVVCTSSLDLGVDFQPVEQVLQIGSAKGVARLLQRAGRSGHAPGRASRIVLVPTHSLELVEAAALRLALAEGTVESRSSPSQPMDVLVQHLVSVALGGGFRPDELLAEVRRTTAYETLSDADWRWALDFVRQGGASLRAYPDFQRIAPDADGLWRVPDARLARRHRANIGTIVADSAVSVQFSGGARLGSVEESFIARLQPGDAFVFAGRVLELLRLHEMTAFVRLAAGKRALVPRWGGGRMPLSSTLADAMLRTLARLDEGLQPDAEREPELHCAVPLLALQRRWSQLPRPQRLVAEVITSREGSHLFLFPFAGRLVHAGLASLLAWRASQRQAGTFSIAINDYGLELLSAAPIDWAGLLPALLAAPAAPAQAGRRGDAGHDGDDPSALRAEIIASLNAAELARRRFREIARIAGLTFHSHPGEQRSARQLQASATLYYEVFQRHDPDNRLLRQAQAELLAQELDVVQLERVLHRMARQTLCVTRPVAPTPLAFPLMVERSRERLSTESLAARIGRMVEQLERRAGAAEGAAQVDRAAVLRALQLPQEERAAAAKPRRRRNPRGRR